MFASGLWHLILAIGWLLLGGAILVADPPSLRLRFGGLDFSVGWVALLFAGYDLARWWSLRSAYRRRRAAEEMERRRPPRRPSGEPEPERNPDFIFDDPPPEKPPQ
jgi:hypothetical protein